MGQALRRIGAFAVPALGLGCMNLSHAYGSPPPDAQSERLLLQALELGVTLFDTAALYGFGRNERLLGAVLKPHRQRITLCSKGGMAGVAFEDGMRRVIDGRPETLRRNCEDSLQRLGTDVIDLYYLHRWDKKVPIEDSVGALSDLVRAGKVRALGLSEVSAATLRRAHAVHPIAALQTEYSLWSRNPEIALRQTCRELGVTLVAFSPLGRGFLCGEVRTAEQLEPQDIRRAMPRFAPDALARNLALADALRALAQEIGCTPAQLALAWLLQTDPDLIAIPGTRDLAHLADNLGAVSVAPSAQLMARLDALFHPGAAHGERYNAGNAAEVDTETFET